jgi:tetratricopeptide (TPR) repeat protein
VWGPFTHAEMRAGVADLPADAHPRIVIESIIAEREGRLEDGIAGAEFMMQQLTELGLRVMVSAPMSSRASMLRRAGRLEESSSTYEEVIALQESFGQRGYLSTTLVDHAAVLYELGELEEAEARAIRGEELGSPEDFVNFSRGRGLRAKIAADRGDDEAALALARSSLEHALRTDFPSEHGGVHEALAHVHAKAGRKDEAREELAQALAVWERYEWTANAERVRALLVQL